MPRSKMDMSKPYSFAINQLAPFKAIFPDFVHDLNIVYKRRKRFFNKCKEANGAFGRWNEITNHIGIQPSVSNRLYIVTNIDDVVMALVDIDPRVIDNLIGVQSFLNSIDGPNSPDFCPIDYISTMYIFKGKKLVLEKDLSPFRLAEFMMVFKKENFIDFSGPRDDYYAKPRRGDSFPV